MVQALLSEKRPRAVEGIQFDKRKRVQTIPKDYLEKVSDLPPASLETIPHQENALDATELRTEAASLSRGQQLLRAELLVGAR
jgi:hypothetical protein